MDMSVVNNTLHHPDDIAPVARSHGVLFQPYAEDYFFIYRNSFPWSRIRDVVVGRPAYDNYIVAVGIENNVTTVDATRTLIAVHQTDSEGNKAGHMNNETLLNNEVIGTFKYWKGRTNFCKYFTDFANTSFTSDSPTDEIVILRR